MKAIVFHSFGGAANLTVADVPAPTPQAGEVLIALSHTSVNPVDWKIREGFLAKAFPHVFPVIPGWDAAGTVTALGAGVDGLKVGDEVYAYARLPKVGSGTYAEQIALPATSVAKKPRSLTLAESAAVPLVGLTAWQGLHDVVGLRKGETVLILGGAGGVGSFAIQFAKHAGARVLATASAANHDYLKSLGADETFDYRAGNVVAAVRASVPAGVDVVFDAVGGEHGREAFGALKEGGRVVGIVDTPSEELAKAHGAKAAYHFVAPNGAQLATIAGLFDAGAVKAPAIAVRSVREAAAAQEENRGRHVRGKVVLTIDF